MRRGDRAASSLLQQTFAWLSRFQRIINHMGVSKATFIVAMLFWMHNRRVIRERGRWGQSEAASVGHGAAPPSVAVPFLAQALP